MTDLQKMIAEFEAKGGKVQKLPSVHPDELAAQKKERQQAVRGARMTAAQRREDRSDYEAHCRDEARYARLELAHESRMLGEQ